MRRSTQRSYRSMSRRRRAGFTLMEVLLVVAILLILGSIAVVSFSGILGGAEEDTTRAQIDQVGKAVQYYVLHCRQFPTEASQLVQKPGDATVAAKWRGPYLEKIPKDAWNGDITITEIDDATFKVASPGGPKGEAIEKVFSKM